VVFGADSQGLGGGARKGKFCARAGAVFYGEVRDFVNMMWLTRFDEFRMRSNDGAVDSSGRFWIEAFVDPEVEEPTKEDALFLMGHDGKLTIKHQGAVIPNGISWPTSDDKMFFTASPQQDVFVFDYNRETGEISNKKVFFHLDEEGVHPDGHIMDVEGNIWHACYGGGKVIRISPKGEITGVVHLPTRNITCVAFAGTSLYITSAAEKEGNKFPDSAKYAGNLFKVDDVGIEAMSKHKAKLDV
jgi:sugar lactone lactonase YvrE